LDLFSEIKQIISLNDIFYKDLANRIDVKGKYEDFDDNMLFADIFVKLAPYFQLYFSYSNNYEKADKLRIKLY